MDKKKGISLIVLTITLVVLSIVTTIVVLRATDVTRDAEKVAFKEELENILGSVKGYYLEHGSFPIIEGIEYTKDEVIAFAETYQNGTLLEEEFSLNKDTSIKFYELDFNKLKISDSMLGRKENMGDIYLLNQDGTQIYYPAGYEVDDIYYFSLSSKLDDKVSINNEENLNNSNIDIQSSSSAIEVLKNTEKETNSLILTVTTILQNEEKLYCSIGGVRTEITVIPSDIVIDNTTISTSQKNELKNDSTVYFEKTIAGSVVAKTNINIENLIID